MRENEFEKQVRKLMDEFHLSPPDSVWEQVRSRIIQRRRKWPLVALLLVAMSGTAYLIYTEFGRATGTTTEKISGKSNHDSSSERDNVAVDQPAQTTIKNTPKIERSNDETITLKNIPPSRTPYQKKITELSSLPGPQIEPAENGKENVLDNNETVTANRVGVNDSKTTADVNTDSIGSAADQLNTMTQFPDGGTTSQQPGTVSGKSNIPPDKNSGKLSIGITAYAGAGNTVENLFGNGSHETVPSANFIPDPLSSASPPEKPFTPSFSYKFGVFVEKNISKRNSVSAGLNYSYFSTKAQVTYANPSLVLAVPGLSGVEYVNSYYRPGETTQHINKYNFLGLDIAFHQSLVSSKNTPLYLDAGLSALQLLSANSLIYDHNTNTYYYKNDWLNKTQFSINAALSLHIRLNSNNYLFVGPEMNYGFTNLLKNKNYTPQHLLSYGLKAGWVIGRK